MTIGNEGGTRTQNEVFNLFTAKYPDLPPMLQGRVSKFEKLFWEYGHVPKPNNPRWNVLH